MQRSILRRSFAVFSAALLTALMGFGLVASANASTVQVNAASQKLKFNNTVKIGQDALEGFTTRYVNVITAGGQSVDAIVTVTDIQNTQLSNIDRVSTVNNDELWTNLRIGANGGSVTYRVEFVLSGTRDPVLMQNFSVNVGDIDARQYVQFTGPSSYTLAQNTQLTPQTPPIPGIPAGAWRFAELNGTGSDDSDTRFWAQVNYASVSAVDVTLGAAIGGSALYQVSFGTASWNGTAQNPVTPPPATYAVSYNINAGGTAGFSGTTTGTSAASGTAQSIQIETFTKPGGWTFVAWNTRADGSGVSYDPNDTIIPTTDVELFAIWKNLNTTVSYEANPPTGATASGTVPSASTVTAGNQYTVLANTGGLTVPGYSFVGWNTTAAGSGVFYLPGTLMNVVANTTFYAVWEPIPVVPPDAPINLDVEPGDPIGGAEVDYVIPDQPYDPNCDPTANSNSAWTIMVTPINPAGTPYEIDAGCTPADGDIYGTTVLPQDVPQGIYEVVYESTTGEKIIRYFEVGPNGTFEGQSNVDPSLAKTGASTELWMILAAALLLAGALLLFAHRGSAQHTD